MLPALRALGRDTQKTQHGIETYRTVDWLPQGCTVETLRKPSTGLKHIADTTGRHVDSGRDTQKTQHGIETERVGSGVG